MKKFLAFFTVLMFLCTAALADSADPIIPLETLTMEDGFTFAQDIPSFLWSRMVA